MMSTRFKRTKRGTNKPVQLESRKKSQKRRFQGRKMRRHPNVQKPSTALARAIETIRQRDEYIALLEARIAKLTEPKPKPVPAPIISLDLLQLRIQDEKAS